MLYMDNPFRILDISPTDSRREIIRQAEEKSLLLDPQTCMEARTILTNPQRRIDAEVHWFIDCTPAEISQIGDFISEVYAGNQNASFQWDSACKLTQFNIMFACLEAQDLTDPLFAYAYIPDFGDLFGAIDPEDVFQKINETRRRAGFPEVARRQDIDAALGKLRSEIRQALSQKLQELPWDDYIRVINLLAGPYAGDGKYRGQAVLEDVLTEYALAVDNDLAEQTQYILDFTALIRASAGERDISEAMKNYLLSLQYWETLARPLQLAALVKGNRHKGSQSVFNALRDMTQSLSNANDLPAEALTITRMAREVFKDFPEYAAVLNEDSDAYAKRLEEKKHEGSFLLIIKPFTAAYWEFVRCPETQRKAKADAFLAAVRSANDQISRQFTDKALSDGFRDRMGLTVYIYIFDLSARAQRCMDALRLLLRVLPVFTDFPKTFEQMTLAVKENIREICGPDIAGQLFDKHRALFALSDEIDKDRHIKRKAKISAFRSLFIELDAFLSSSINDAEVLDLWRKLLVDRIRMSAENLSNKGDDPANARAMLIAVKGAFPDMPSMTGPIDNDIRDLTAKARKRVFKDMMLRLNERMDESFFLSLLVMLVTGFLFVAGIVALWLLVDMGLERDAVWAHVVVILFVIFGTIDGIYFLISDHLK